MERKKGICQKCKKNPPKNKTETVSEITRSRGIPHTSFQGPNVQHVESSTEQWREMASLLGNTETLSKPHTD